MLLAMADVIPEGIRLGIVRGISYGLFANPTVRRGASYRLLEPRARDPGL